jgi:hypothetical protein
MSAACTVCPLTLACLGGVLSFAPAPATDADDAEHVVMLASDCGHDLIWSQEEFRWLVLPSPCARHVELAPAGCGCPVCDPRSWPREMQLSDRHLRRLGDEP